jgi:hypothetical protein
VVRLSEVVIAARTCSTDLVGERRERCCLLVLLLLLLEFLFLLFVVAVHVVNGRSNRK